MDAVTRLGVAELLRAYGARRVSPVEVVDAVAGRIEVCRPPGRRLPPPCAWSGRAKEAQVAEAAWAGGTARPLEGIPFAAKDLFDSEGVRTAYGSPIFADHIPGRDAEAIRRARAAGAVLVGKTQTHEFAWGITSVNERAGVGAQPLGGQRVAGGSSGGSAVVLAADEVPLTLGSDTGGSIGSRLRSAASSA